MSKTIINHLIFLKINGFESYIIDHRHMYFFKVEITFFFIRKSLHVLQYLTFCLRTQ